MNINSVHILGVKVDEVNLSDSVAIIDEWLGHQKKRVVVTPNVEFIMSAQSDNRFKDILNAADLAIPDAARLGWAIQELSEKNFFKKLLIFPLFLFPRSPFIKKFPVTTGVDLTKKLISLSVEKGYRIGFLGGSGKVAIKLEECLKKQYSQISLEFVSADIVVDKEGNTISIGKSIMKNSRKIAMPPLDILFVALGHIKQEKWIVKNINSYPAKIMIGVGGTMDYLSGVVPRAPKWMRDIGMEWLFRLILQPWRIARFGNLVKFVFLVLLKK